MSQNLWTMGLRGCKIIGRCASEKLEGRAHTQRCLRTRLLIVSLRWIQMGGGRRHHAGIIGRVPHSECCQTPRGRNVEVDQRGSREHVRIRDACRAHRPEIGASNSRAVGLRRGGRKGARCVRAVARSIRKVRKYIMPG